MKKIFCLLGLLMAFNVHAQQLNMGAVLNGKTNDMVCFLYSEPGYSEKGVSVFCGNKAGQTGSTTVNISSQRTIADFVGTGIWSLSGTFLAAKNSTVFVFTKK